MGKVFTVSFNDIGIEAQALSQVLELYGLFVLVEYIVRPNDFIDVLKDNVLDKCRLHQHFLSL